MSRPFDDTLALIAGLPGPDEAARAAATQTLAPLVGVGRLGELAVWMATWQGRCPAQVRRPIVALTAHALPDDQEACRAAGMNAFLTKPYDMMTLLRALSNAMQRPLAIPPANA